MSRYGRLARQAADAVDRLERGEEVLVLGDRLIRAVRSEQRRRGATRGLYPLPGLPGARPSVRAG